MGFSREKKNLTTYRLSLFLILLICVIRITRSYGDFFQYEKILTIENPLRNPYESIDLSFTLNTKSLIQEKKLRSDCADIRIGKVNSNEEIVFLIEGECGFSDETLIWIRCSVMNESEEIFIRYGNHLSESVAITWNGSFIFFSDSSSTCPGDFSEVATEMNGRFVMGSRNFHYGGSSSHSHQFFGYSVPNDTVLSIAEGTLSMQEMSMSAPHPSNCHEHYFNITTSASTNLPDYFTLRFCEKSGTLNKIPSTTIAMFDQDVVPSEYGVKYSVSNFDDRFIRYSASAKSTGGTVYGHTHFVDGESMMDDKGGCKTPATTLGTDYCVMYPHKHKITLTEVHYLMILGYKLPYIEMVFGKNELGDINPIPGMIIGSTSKPPLGWEDFLPLDDVFLKSTTGSFTGTRVDVGETGAHEHSSDVHCWTYYNDCISQEAEAPFLTTCDSGGPLPANYGRHTHYTQFDSSNENSMPLYVGLNFIKRKNGSLFHLNLSNETELRYSCFSIDYEDEEVCNFQSGNCVRMNLCECTLLHFYGLECNEKISGAFLSVEHEDRPVDYLFIHYEVNVSRISDFQEPYFDCSLIFSEMISLGSGKCAFEEGVKQTISVKVLFEKKDYSVSIGDNILVKSLSDPSVLISLEVKRFIGSPTTTKGDNFFGKILPFWWILPIVVVLLVCIYVIFYCFVGILMFTIQKQRKKIGKFNKIEDIDILLKESVSDVKLKFNFRINKDFFEIDYSSIKLLSIIDSGGGNTKIMKALWNKKEIAYKYFHGSVFSDQHVYEDFVREFSLAIKLKHPNVLSFYGGCFSPPNIGIAMELCENGSVGDYIRKISLNVVKPLDFGEKIRILKEISDGMMFLREKQLISNLCRFKKNNSS